MSNLLNVIDDVILFDAQVRNAIASTNSLISLTRSA